VAVALTRHQALVSTMNLHSHEVGTAVCVAAHSERSPRARRPHSGETSSDSVRRRVTDVAAAQRRRTSRVFRFRESCADYRFALPVNQSLINVGAVR
jgi:hypothetical protein